MRILHTSDWHLGRSFHRVGMLDAQAAYVDHLVAVVEAEQVDLVVVSGDVYDRALPPVDAVELADDTFARLAASRAQVVVSSGNHDSPARLGFNARLADAAGVHLRTRWQDVGAPVLLEDAHGPVAVYGIPYLEPDAVRSAWELPARSHEAALTAAMTRVHADLAGRAGTRSVVLAHAFVAGSADAAPRMASRQRARHLRRRHPDRADQPVHGRRLRGPRAPARVGRRSPTRSVTAARRWPTRSPRPARPRAPGWSTSAPGACGPRSWCRPRCRGGWRPCAAGSTTCSRTRGTPAVEDAWLQVTLTDPRRPQHAMDRLRDRFPHTLMIGFEPEGATATRGPVMPRVDGRSDLDVALGFVAEVRELEATTEEELLLQLACDSCRVNDDRDADFRLDPSLFSGEDVG